MAGLLGAARELVHYRQSLVYQAVERRMHMRHGKELEAERIAVATGIAHHILARHQAFEHAVNLIGAAVHFLDDLGARKAMGLCGEQLQNIQTFVQSRRTVAVVSSRRIATILQLGWSASRFGNGDIHTGTK